MFQIGRYFEAHWSSKLSEEFEIGDISPSKTTIWRFPNIQRLTVTRMINQFRQKNVQKEA